MMEDARSWSFNQTVAFVVEAFDFLKIVTWVSLKAQRVGERDTYREEVAVLVRRALSCK